MAPLGFKSRGGVPAARDEAAVYWVARRRLGLTSARETARFEAWRADPENAAALAAAESPLETAAALAGADEILALREAALARYPARRDRRGLVGALATAAAVAGLAVLAALLLGPARLGVPPATPSTAPAPAARPDGPAVQRYASRHGERLSVRLADGSHVTLNTDSLLEVAYDERQRRVRLIQGQALFEVAKHQPRPFVVEAGDRRITATGTAFDVRLDRDRVKVVLIEGRVVVDPLQARGLAGVLPLERQALAPGEELRADAGQAVSVTAADVDRDTGWSRGQLVFRDARLGDAVAEMNRYAARTVVIEDPRIAELKISGVFGTARPENFQAMLTQYYPLVLTPRTGAVQVLRWRASDDPRRGS